MQSGDFYKQQLHPSVNTLQPMKQWALKKLLNQASLRDNMKNKVVPVHTTKAHGTVEVQLYSLLSSALHLGDIGCIK
jgi:hypothetical protein